MGFPAIFAFFVIIAILFNYRIKKLTREEAKVREAFWQRERESLIVRKKDFDENDFITPDISSLRFPNVEFIGYELKLYQASIDKINSLIQKPMMNFSGLTNTEVRLRFGTANQTTITNNEGNYNSFLKALYDYGQLMEKSGETEEALSAYEICISINSEYTKHYISLAKLYLQQNNKKALSALREKASQVDQMAQTKILSKLDELSLN